mmetsp:Transcript_31150/g.36009  ORF Transcript_31150/g.36009 Transcript_31150/m.36009 type:complete len:128 (-) Transcript_31150:33-416(-)
MLSLSSVQCEEKKRKDRGKKMNAMEIGCVLVRRATDGSTIILSFSPEHGVSSKYLNRLFHDNEGALNITDTLLDVFEDDAVRDTNLSRTLCILFLIVDKDDIWERRGGHVSNSFVFFYFVFFVFLIT